MLQPITSFFSTKTSTPSRSLTSRERFRVPADRAGSRTPQHMGGEETDSSKKVETCLEAIELWLKWEACQESLTELMYRQRSEGARIEALLDECERLRFQASEASKRLVETRHVGN